MSDSLQFDRAEYVSAPAATACANCRQQIVQSYYELNGKFICSNCRHAITQGLSDGSRGVRIGRALVAGLGAAVAGAVVWWGVRRLTGYEVGLISIGIGIAVGKAVRWGSSRRGGWAYQLLAILLTYGAVTMNYIPDVVQGFVESEQKQTAPTAKPLVQKASAAAPAAKEGIRIGVLLLGIGSIVLIAAAVPFLHGAENIIGILIIAFGLYEAWKINKRTPLTFSGPFSVAPAAPPSNV
jgi:fermentation-respiration switch protein FrsA (DUF1100 family)